MWFITRSSVKTDLNCNEWVLGSQVLGAGVVSAVHDSADGAGQGDPEFGSCRSSASSLRHSGS